MHFWMSEKQWDWPTMISSSNENADVFMLWEWFPTVQSVRENITTANKCSSQRNTTTEPLSTESLVNKCLYRCYGVRDDSLCPYSLWVFMWNSFFVLGGMDLQMRSSGVNQTSLNCLTDSQQWEKMERFNREEVKHIFKWERLKSYFSL